MAHIQDRGKAHKRRWQARYRDPSGQEKSKTFERKLDARRWLDEVTADMLTGRYIDPRAGTLKLRDFALGWLEAQTFDASTRHTMASRIHNHIIAELGDVELRHLKPSTVQAWVRALQSDLSSSYCRLLLANLSTILAAAVEDGLMATNPATASSVKAPRVDRKRIVPWTVGMVQAVVDGHRDDLRALPIVGAGCGFRQGEIFGLTVDSVDFLRREVHVRRQLRRVDRDTVLAPPKGGRERVVPLPEVVSVALAEHLRRFGPTRAVSPWQEPGGEPVEVELLFADHHGQPLTRSYYTHHGWLPALESAGIERSRENGMHALRHHYASVLLDEGVSIRAVAEYLGHHDPGFTLRTYAHLMPESEDRARAAVDSAHSRTESVRNETAGET